MRKILKKIDRISGFLINNYGDYQFLLENNLNKNVWCGEGLNICNSQSLKFWDSLNIKGVELSSEIGIKEINEMNIPKNMETDYFFYGNTKLMTLKYCPISPILNCNLSESSCKNCHQQPCEILAAQRLHPRGQRKNVQIAGQFLHHPRRAEKIRARSRALHYEIGRASCRERV